MMEWIPIENGFTYLDCMVRARFMCPVAAEDLVSSSDGDLLLLRGGMVHK